MLTLYLEYWPLTSDVQPCINIPVDPDSLKTEGRFNERNKEVTSKMLSVRELAELLQVPAATIYRWRSRGEGPRGYRIGKHVRFRRVDVEAWLESRRDAERGY